MALVKDVDRFCVDALLRGTLKWSEKFYLDRGYDLCHAYCRIPSGRKKIVVFNATMEDGFDSRCLGWWPRYYLNIRQGNRRNATFYPLDYQASVGFYSSKYDTTVKKDNEIPGLRTTLYQGPKFVTDERGSTSLSFYTSDQPGNYFACIEGISEDGELIYIVKVLMP